MKFETDICSFSFSSAKSLIFLREFLCRNIAAKLLRTNFDDMNSSIELGVLDFGLILTLFVVFGQCICCRDTVIGETVSLQKLGSKSCDLVE